MTTAPAALLLALLASAAPAGDGPLHPFDGKTLDGWDGDRSFWSVQDGAIVGKSTAEHPLPASAYIVWSGDMPQDFDLRAKVLITAGNSGIQYRSRRVDGRADMSGFQADLDANNSYTGILYEGLGREIMSGRGEQVEWTPSGKRVTATFAPDAVLKDVMKPGQWNDYRVEARGTRVRHWINGTLMTDVTDGDASRFRRDGQLGFQLHQGAPMEVRWKDIEVHPILEAPPVTSLALPEGFTAELVASAQPGQGSWVSLAFDPNGRAIVSPQQGATLRIELPGIGANAPKEARITAMPDVPPSAQGLCFAGDELWVDSSAPGPAAGLWRLRDADGDGTYEKQQRVLEWKDDGGEHGPHGVVAGPDGAIYIALGNHTAVPAGVDRGACAPWAEDLVGERMWDPRGHAVGIVAPGGTVLRVDPATGTARVFASGFRNHYDLAFNPDGELFTYDSDMEWDIGAPWYRAPRFVHVVNGGEFGWRSGSGCLPSWTPDTLPPAGETDSSSPTGMLHGAGGAFPAPWRDMLFAADWTYGRILAVKLTPAGSSYTAAWQPFITGRPMPVTDMAWGPEGAMYVVTGGRGTQSGIYRIAAKQPVPASKRVATPDASHAKDRAQRRALEDLAEKPDAATRERCIAAVGADDRFTAFAARNALERLGTDATHAGLDARSPRIQAMSLLAEARSAGHEWSNAVASIAALPRLATADTTTKLIALRAVQVAWARHHESFLDAGGHDLTQEAADFAARFFNDADPRVAESALALSCAMGRGEAVAPAMKHLLAATDRADAMRWATMLRTVATGWTDELRVAYWRWLDAADDRSGGFSLRGFIDHVKEDADKHVHRPAGSAATAVASAPAPAPMATGAPIHAWTVAELSKPAAGDTAPDRLRGEQLFRESMCIQCHRFGGDGGANGPDLTGVGSRFARNDLLRAIIEPSATVSDQWRDSAVHTKDGAMVVGRIVRTEGAGTPQEAITVSVNPLGPERERILRSDIERIEPVATSSMPAGLLNAHTRQEILDLLGYLEGGTGAAPGAGVGNGGTLRDG